MSRPGFISLVLLGVIAAPAFADPALQFAPIGSYSNYEFTEEHQYGAKVSLWRDGTTVHGQFSYSEGLMGDTPTGLLQDVSFDAATGKIAFSAKLTMGLHSCNIHGDVPSRDLFSFEGVLSSSSLSGTLRHVDALHPDGARSEERVVLKRTDEELRGYGSREQWRASLKDVLQFRGPKW